MSKRTTAGHLLSKAFVLIFLTDSASMGRIYIEGLSCKFIIEEENLSFSLLMEKKKCSLDSITIHAGQAKIRRLAAMLVRVPLHSH